MIYSDARKEKDGHNVANNSETLQHADNYCTSRGQVLLGLLWGKFVRMNHDTKSLDTSRPILSSEDSTC